MYTALHRARMANSHPVLAAAGITAELIGRGVLGVVTAMLFLSIVPNLTGWSSQVVMSGSMMPRVAPGDVVVTAPVRPETLIPGQIILMENPARPGTLLMHRLVSRNLDGTLVTRGDANREADSTPVAPSMVRGLPRLRIPYIGLPTIWLHHGDYGPVALTAIALLAALALCARRSPMNT